MWRWKDWIDQRFMNRFRNLPIMIEPPAGALVAEFDEQMHCGGCGAKVSADLLQDVLDTRQAHQSLSFPLGGFPETVW